MVLYGIRASNKVIIYSYVKVTSFIIKKKKKKKKKKNYYEG